MTKHSLDAHGRGLGGWMIDSQNLTHDVSRNSAQTLLHTPHHIPTLSTKAPELDLRHYSQSGEPSELNQA